LGNHQCCGLVLCPWFPKFNPPFCLSHVPSVIE
jgi:hypothetical protein